MSNAVDKAYTKIRSCILSGKFAAGSHLKEEYLAEEIGVSRTPIREALRRLNSEHLVTFIPNQGASVTMWSYDDVNQIFTLRAMLEGQAARLAAERISDGQIAAMGELMVEMDALTKKNDRNWEEITPYNSEFHKIIITAAHSERLEQMVKWLIEIPIVLRTFRSYDRDDMLRSMRHHRELVDALGAHDPDWAESVMRAHIFAARSVYLSAQEQEAGQGQSSSDGVIDLHPKAHCD